MATLAAFVLVALVAVALLLAGLKRPILLVLGAVFTMSLDYVGQVGLGPLTFNNLLKASAVLLVAIRMLQTGDAIRIPGNLLHFVPFILLAGAASLYSQTFAAAFGGWLRLVFVWVFAILVANLLRNERDLRWLLGVMAGVLFINALLAGIQASQVFSQGVLAIHGLEQSHRVGVRASGAFWSPNKMAVHLGGMIVLLVAALPSARRTWLKVFYLGAILLGLLAILFSLSRSGFVFVGTAALLFLFSKRHRRHALGFIGLGILGVLVLLFFTSYGDVLLERVASFTTVRDGGSASIRSSLILTGLFIFGEGMNFLWGTGYKSYVVAMIDHVEPLMNHDGFYHAGIRASHNLWISILSEQGLIGITAVLFFLRGVYREFAALLRGEQGGLERNLTIGLMVYVSVKLIDFNFNPELEENMFWFALGILGALALRAVDADGKAIPLSEPKPSSSS